MDQTPNTKDKLGRTLGAMFEDQRLKLLARSGAFMFGVLIGFEVTITASTTLYDRLAPELPEVSSTALNPIELVGEMMETMILNPMDLLAVLSLYLLIVALGVLFVSILLAADTMMLAFWGMGQETFTDGGSDG